jgi:hypothetical protein
VSDYKSVVVQHCARRLEDMQAGGHAGGRTCRQKNMQAGANVCRDRHETNMSYIYGMKHLEAGAFGLETLENAGSEKCTH